MNNMNIFDLFRPSWLPTPEEREQYRQERMSNWRKELPEIQERMTTASKNYSIYERQLTGTFNNDQMELWLQLKKNAQDMMFEQGRFKHHTDELYSKDLSEALNNQFKF